LGLTAGECSKTAETGAKSPELRQGVETIGRWLSAKANGTSESELVKLSRQINAKVDPADLQVGREAVANDGAEVAQAVEASTAGWTVADQQDALKYACKAWKATDPQATPQQRYQALLSFVPFSPGTEAGSRRIKGYWSTLQQIDAMSRKGDQDRAKVWAACLVIGA
jgi:hypothetical protein